MIKAYLALPLGLLVATNQDGRWQVQHQLAGKHAQCVAVDPLKQKRLYCGTMGDGLFYSDDAGGSWQPVGAGIASKDVMAVAVSRNEQSGGYGVVYAGSEPTSLYRSEDGGQTWQECSTLRELPSAPIWSFPPRPYTSHVRAIVLDPLQPGKLYVAIEAGALVRSVDGGQTWLDRVQSGPRDSHTLVMHPQVPERVYAAAGDGFMRPGREFAQTFDGGDTWQYFDDGISYTYGWGLAVDPGDPETIVLSSAHSPNQAHNPEHAEAVIYRRSGDSAWQQVSAGLPEPAGSLAYQLCTNEAEPGVFYALNNRGFFRSADAGRSWEGVAIPWPPEYRSQHAQALAVTGTP